MAFHRVMMLVTSPPYTNDTNDDDYYPPTLPSLLSPPPIISPVEDPSPNKHISLKMIIIVAILSASFLLSTYALILRFCCKWIMSRRSAPQNNIPPAEVDDDDDDDHGNQEPLHHVWYITTVGLEESVINSITVCKYNRHEGLIDGSECSVCLSEFRDGDDVRLLPKCNHAFHVPCIDTWLRSHVNCPLCRASVLSNGLNSSPANPNPDSLDAAEETQTGNSEIDVPLEGNRSCRIESDLQEDEAELDSDELVRDIETGAEMSSAGESHGFGVQSDSSDVHRPLESTIDMNDNNMEPIRRSVSMDSLSVSLMRITSTDPFPMDSEGSSSGTAAQPLRNEKSNPVELSMTKKPAPNRNQGILKMLSVYSKGAFLPRPILLKRSFSAGCKFLVPGYGRSRNAILPL